MDPLEPPIARDLDVLCRPGDRMPGADRNRQACAYVVERLRAAGCRVDSIPFDVPEWVAGNATARIADQEFDLHAGPFSAPCDGAGPLVVARCAADLDRISPGAVVLLLDELAASQLVPRGYPFYSDETHARLADRIEQARPLTLLAATTSSAMTGGQSPFPVIEEVGFAVPTAYLPADVGQAMAVHAGREAAVRIDSVTRPSYGTQPTGSLGPAGADRVIVCAHVDTKPDTPGALDNAAGVAVLLGVADLFAKRPLATAVEFVPFNGEDHVQAPGEMAWLARPGALEGITMVINIDAAGLAGSRSAYSLYNVDEPARRRICDAARPFASVCEGPQWPASDHMIFAMRGIPCMAITSEDFETASRVYSHTPSDEPSVVQPSLLADAARFVADVVEAVSR